MKGNAMNYFAVVDKNPDSAFGIWFPDVEGCFSAADNEKDIIKNAMEALCLHLEGAIAPPARGIEEIRAQVAEDLLQGAYLISVPLISQSQRQVRANISMSKSVLDAIDNAAALRNLTRSAFIAEAALNEIAK